MESEVHILIIDGQPDNLLVLEDLLSQHYTVHAGAAQHPGIISHQPGKRS